MSEYLNDLFNLKGKTALLTGAGGHIVSELSLGLARAGCNVVVGDVRLHKAQEVVDRITGEGGVAFPVEIDVVQKDSWAKALEATLGKYGKVDILLNGAGINAPTPFFDITVEEWDRVLGVCLTGTLLGCQVVGAKMVEQASGSIINISSASAGPPLSKAFAYSVAKSGVKNLTQNVARELAPKGVRVNSLRPGFLPTDWNLKNFITEERKASILNHTPMNRFGEPIELVGAVLWLASDAATFVTGAEICVDGGFLAMTI
jgi:NAD(P)-dependent dehydrogenase (short-subunit alcohol dehydrogenase family)